MKTSTMPFLLTLLLLLNVRSNAFIKGIPCGKMSIYRSYSPSRYEQETTAWIMVKRRRSIGGNLRSIQEASVLWESYNVALERNPLLVKSLTAGVILGLADFTGQAVENLQSEGDNKGIDFARAARFSIFGLVLQAPWNHFYYLLLDGQIPPTPEPFSETNILKVFIDQFIQAPIFTVLIFGFLGVLEGKDTSSIKQQLDNDYKETIVANWKLWVPATVINIAFVPPILRVLYLNGVFFFWSIYLSLVLNKEEENPSV